MSKTKSKARAGVVDVVEVVDPRWLVRVFLLAVVVAACCGYGVLCWIFWQGQWQLVLHPVAAMTATPAAAGLPYEAVEITRPGGGNLAAWRVPSAAASAPTMLLLHGGDEDMSGLVPLLAPLHAAGYDLLAIEYAGYGQSTGVRHADEASMTADAATALGWAAGHGHVLRSSVVVFGRGLGAAIATRLADENGCAGLVLVDPVGDMAEAAGRDPRARMVPFRILFRNDFPLADALHASRVPKLLVSIHDAGMAPEVAQRAADPKLTVEFSQTPADAELTAAVERFTGMFLTQAPASLGAR